MSNSKFGLRTRKGLIRSFVEGVQAVLWNDATTWNDAINWSD